MPLEHTEPWGSPTAGAIMKVKIETQVLCESRRGLLRRKTDEEKKPNAYRPFYIFSRPLIIGLLLDKAKCNPCLGFISWRILKCLVRARTTRLSESLFRLLV